jgi:hypothetical protein
MAWQQKSNFSEVIFCLHQVRLDHHSRKIEIPVIATAAHQNQVGAKPSPSRSTISAPKADE